MRNACALGLLVLVSSASIASAQTSFTMSGKCGKPDLQQAVPAGTAADHFMTLATGKCTPVKPAEFAGSPSKESAFAEHGEVKGNEGKVWGSYVDTLASGEKVYYRYEGTAVLLNGALQSMQNKWTIVGASPRLAGLKGSGTCKGSGTADGGLEFECTGDYTLAGK